MSQRTPPPHVDLYSLGEDDRITVIGETASSGKLVGVALESHEPEKIARYIEKVTRRFPMVRLVDRTAGPVPGVMLLRFGPRPS